MNLKLSNYPYPNFVPSRQFALQSLLQLWGEARPDRITILSPHNPATIIADCHEVNFVALHPWELPFTLLYETCRLNSERLHKVALSILDPLFLSPKEVSGTE